MCHTKFFVHAWGNSIDRSGAADFVIEFWGDFFSASNDFLAFFAIWIPSVFFFGAGFLAESREGDLREAVFDDFVAFFDS